MLFVPFISEVKTTWRASCRNRLGVNSTRTGKELSACTGKVQGRREGRDHGLGSSGDMASV